VAQPSFAPRPAAGGTDFREPTTAPSSRNAIPDPLPQKIPRAWRRGDVAKVAGRAAGREPIGNWRNTTASASTVLKPKSEPSSLRRRKAREARDRVDAEQTTHRPPPHAARLISLEAKKTSSPQTSRPPPPHAHAPRLPHPPPHDRQAARRLHRPRQNGQPNQELPSGTESPPAALIE